MQSNKKILVTTALESTWGSKEPIVFLGEWCKKYSMRKIWKLRDYETFDYHWRDRKKLTKDHKYLETLNESLLQEITIFLNNYHNVKKSTHYWRIIIGPWLVIYISIIWDRWESISVALDNNEELETFLLENALPRNIANDFVSFRAALDSDRWNHGIFGDILRERANSKIKIIPIKSQLLNETILPKLKLTFRQKFLRLLANITDTFIKVISSKNQKIVFFHSYFRRKYLLHFYLKLQLWPRWHTSLKEGIHYPKAKNREHLSLKKIDTDNKFEKYLFQSILRDIPISYLEGYKDLRIAANKLVNAKTIFTANAYIGNELFKVWSAEQVHSGSRLIISSHGGAFYPLYNWFNHEEKIGDPSIVWGKEWDDSQTRMPSNKIYFKVKDYDQGGRLLFVDYETTRYGFRCVSVPMGPLVLDVFNHNNQFLKSLDQSIINNVRVRPKSLGSWETELRYKDNFGENIISKVPTILKDIERSKIVVCSYPQTCFTESMFAGIPTILLLTKENWECKAIYDDLFLELERAKILHFNPVEAASHVKEIYSDPMLWWQSEEVLLARKKFDEICLTIADNPINEWTQFFKNINLR